MAIIADSFKLDISVVERMRHIDVLDRLLANKIRADKAKQERTT